MQCFLSPERRSRNFRYIPYIIVPHTWGTYLLRRKATADKFPFTKGKREGGELNKILYGEAPLRGPTTYPFLYYFW